MTDLSPRTLADQVLRWFDASGRTDLPWRDAPSGQRDPYRVWLSEIMLQQTTCRAVMGYFEKFTRLWPDVKALAAADSDDVMRAWAGLGYYARARNMIKCARIIAFERQGVFPTDERDLLELPGIGPYSAAAISAIAFHGPSAPVDGNVIRVLSRLYAIKAVMPANKGLVGEYAAKMLPQGHSGTFAEALMDLGATVCKPKKPDCPLCPWQGSCRARTLAQGTGQAIDFPRKAPKKDKPARTGWVFWVQRNDGQVLLERRPDTGLLGGMTGFPTSAWQGAEISPQRAFDAQGYGGTWQVLDQSVRHTFTHFHLHLGVIKVDWVEGRQTGFWCPLDEVRSHALPSVMRKVVKVVE